jgi:hypothetical protein
MGTFRTLGEALDAGWKVRMRCQRGDQRGIVKIDTCRHEATLCLLTLVSTRGRAFPIARIADRIRCPNCGDLGVMLAFDVPGGAVPVFKPTYYGRRGG